MQLAQIEEDFAAQGVALAAMTYDNGEVLRAYREQTGMTIPLLQDEGFAHVKALGIMNEQYSPGDGAYGVGHPGMLFIGRDGVIKAKFAEPGYRARPDGAWVLAVIEELINGS